MPLYINVFILAGKRADCKGATGWQLINVAIVRVDLHFMLPDNTDRHVIFDKPGKNPSMRSTSPKAFAFSRKRAINPPEEYS